MSVRTMRAAEVGWSLFWSVGPRPTHEQINESLITAGLPPVSARMYDHYSRLERHGFTSYAPINELDMFVKAERRARKSE